MFEGTLLTADGIEAVTKLPTKQELMQTTAVLVKAVPTKLARLLNQAGAQRLARVTKQASGQKLVQAIKAVEGKME
jgi:ribosomal protein L10